MPDQVTGPLPSYEELIAIFEAPTVSNSSIYISDKRRAVILAALRTAASWERSLLTRKPR
jgi:hypothetical protein